jgi:hypothetical protein
MSTTAPGDERRDRGECELSEEQRDSVVLDLMLCDAAGAPWSVEELARALERRSDALDSVCRLAEAGLVHRIGEFVFPPRAARGSWGAYSSAGPAPDGWRRR